jgi:hypothetical protein
MRRLRIEAMWWRIARALCQLACIVALSVGAGTLLAVSPVFAGGGTATAPSASGTPVTRPGALGTPTQRPAANATPTAPARTEPGTATASPVKPKPSPTAAEATPTGAATPRATPTPRVASPARVLRQPAPLAVRLNGRDQVAEFTVVIAVDGIAPEHDGWELTLRMDQFRTEGVRTRTLPSGAVSLAGVAVACAASPCAVPDNTIASPMAMPSGAARTIFAAAPGDGSGDFVVTATFRVEIPANAYAGTYLGTADVEASLAR